VPVALAVAALVWYLNRGTDDAAIKAITVLVVVCPSALLLASLCARRRRGGRQSQALSLRLRISAKTSPAGASGMARV